MNDIPDKLKRLGFGEWLFEAYDPESLRDFAIARVTAVHKDSYTVSDGVVNVLAELAGKILFNASSPIDYPIVGDWILVHFYDDKTFAVIMEVLNRKSLLKRKTPGKKVDIQLIAANIDVAFILQSLNQNFNLRRLERYLVMTNEGNIQPVVLLSKSDLITGEEVEKRIIEIHKIMQELLVIPFSNESEFGLEKIKQLLDPGHTYCLLGSSGVGKTTLMNNLIGEQLYKTKEVSRKKSKGRHATTSRQMIQLASGALVIDTPGMRELGNISGSTGIEETFTEIISLAEECRFSDCSHSSEKGCAVLDAVERGLLPQERYQNFLKLNKEFSFNEMSYLEKRRKDKKFGKLCKTVMKHKKKQR